MLLTLASLTISLGLLAFVAWLAYSIGRSVNIHRSHRPCIDQGYTEGVARGEEMREKLLDRVIDLENQLNAACTERDTAEAEIQTWRRAATEGIQQLDDVLGTDTLAMISDSDRGSR